MAKAEPAVQVIEELTNKQVEFRIFVHPGRVNSLEQAAQERMQSPEQVIRSILFRVSENEFIMVLVAGPKQIPWKTLRKFLNVSRITMATDDEVKQVTGYQPGSVTPFGLPYPLRIFIDQKIVELADISIGSGQRGVAIILKAGDLEQALPGAEKIDLDPLH